VAAGRHQTLRHAMDWSYELLSPGDQSVFAQLAVFVGGFTLDAAAEVCVRGDRDAAVDAVSRIVDASLVVPDQRPDAATSGTRYRTLKTVREYAATRLREAGNVVDAQERHAAYFAGLAAQAEAELSGSAQTEWLTRLDSEHDNMLAALSFLASAESAGQALLEFTVRLTRFWYIRGHLSEARERLARALAAAPDADLPLRRRALTAAASIALLQGDYSAATEFAEDSLAAARQTGEDRLVANGLSNLGAIVLAAGDQERAGQLLDEAVELARGVGDGRILALALNNLADHALTVGEYQRAEPLFAESLELLRERGDTANVARSLYNLGAAALKLGRLDEARARLRDSLVQSRAAGDKEDLCWCLVGMAALAAARGEGERAARLLGAADGLLAQIGGQYKPFERRLHDDTEVSLSRLLIEDSLKVLRAAGAAMATEDVLDYAAET
jgi:non-specific serine/threonine protein kinase